jgi:hypothetical protein
MLMAVSAVGFGLFTIVFGIVSPAQAPHALHNLVVASLLLVMSAPPVIAVARDPDRSVRPLVILAAVGIAGLATMALSLTPDPFTLPFVVLVGVLWMLQSDRSGALPPGRPSRILLGLVLVAAAPLVIFAIGQAELQRTDHSSEHAAFFHWVETSFYAAAILLLGGLAAVRPVAYRRAAWYGGIALALLGVGSLALSSHASAIPMPWASAAVVGALGFIGVTEWEVRRRAAIS